MLKNGLDYCTCKKKTCVRFGKCAECTEYHATKSKTYPQPFCAREKNIQKLQKMLERQAAAEKKRADVQGG